jgi:hypothetical protein
MRRVAKVLVIAVVVILALAGAGLVALQPLARWETRRVLGGLNGMRGSFESVHVRLRDLSYEIHGLRLDKVGPNGRGEPFVQLPEARAGLYFKELIRGHVVASVDLLRPRLTLVQSNRPAEKRTPQEAGGVAEHVQSVFPIRIDRLQVKDGEVVWVEAREPEKPVLRLHGVQATLENFASRPALARGEPTVVAGRGVLQSSGQVQFFASADPLAKSLTFAGQGSVRELALREVGALVESKTDVAPTKGTIDIFARFVARDGRLSGGVRPMVHGADLKAGKKGIGPKIKEWLGDLGLAMFKSQQTDTVAATIPIEGTVGGPQTQAVPTIMTVLRNAFVRGLQGGMGGLPPPKARQPEGVVEQARRALSPDRGQPRAQPQEGKKR